MKNPGHALVVNLGWSDIVEKEPRAPMFVTLSPLVGARSLLSFQTGQRSNLELLRRCWASQNISGGLWRCTTLHLFQYCLATSNIGGIKTVQILSGDHTRWKEFLTSPTLGLKIFVTWMLMHDLFAVANLLVSLPNGLILLVWYLAHVALYKSRDCHRGRQLHDIQWSCIAASLHRVCY